MSLWLFLTPALVWVVAGTWGGHLIRSSPEDLWKGMQVFRTESLPFDPSNLLHRSAIAQCRLQGWGLVCIAVLFTLMAILVAAGIVPAASN